MNNLNGGNKMMLSKREHKILDLADALKLAHEIKSEVWERFDIIDCWSTCNIDFDGNADLVINWKIRRKLDSKDEQSK